MSRRGHISSRILLHLCCVSCLYAFCQTVISYELHPLIRDHKIYYSSQSCRSKLPRINNSLFAISTFFWHRHHLVPTPVHDSDSNSHSAIIRNKMARTSTCPDADIAAICKAGMCAMSSVWHCYTAECTCFVGIKGYPLHIFRQRR